MHCGAYRVALFVVLPMVLARPTGVSGQTSEPERLKRCATTPTYKYFEQVQYDAYTSSPVLLQELAALRDQQHLLDSIEATGKLLESRNNPLGSTNWKSDDADKYIRRSLKELKLPTCYENPLTYFMLTQYARGIDEARKDLRLPLPSRVNLATLPTTEINAYTYPATHDIGSVIALNTQLFMFAYQMTKVTLPTIGIANDESTKRVAVNHSLEQALQAIVTKPDLPTNFTLALLEFLLLTPPSTAPLDQSYDALVISFTEGMEKFAVAHEYGHVIKKHSSPTMNVRLGADDEANARARYVPVLARSWNQELEADQIGLQLLLRSLKRDAESSVDNDLRWVYTLKGALFFFKCLDIVEQAKAVRDTGKLPMSPSLAERIFIRAFADGRSSPEQNQRNQHLIARSHPPAWLRLERIQTRLASELAARPPSPSSLAYADIADGIIDNIQLLWNVVAPKFPLAVEVAKLATRKGQLPDNALMELKARGEAENTAPVISEFAPGCFVETDSWSSSFLCSPTLQEAVASFQSGSTDDAVVLKLYESALRSDWLLLSGIQARWAESRLLHGDLGSRQNALAIAALSGDRQSLDVLEKLDTTLWPDSDRQMLLHSKRFLNDHGRNTSTTLLASTNPATLRLVDYLCYPEPLGSNLDIAKLIPSTVGAGVLSYLVHNSSVSLGGSISSIALTVISERRSIGDGYNVWADLLAEAGETDAALRFANAGISSGGDRASLENSIGNILSTKRNLRAANDHYAASLAAGRIDGWPELNTAINLNELGDSDGAEMWFRRAIARRATVRSEAELGRFLNEFAWFLVTKRSGDDSKAKEALGFSEESNRIVRRRQPNYLDTLAECQARVGDVNGAVKTAEEALDLIGSDNQAEKQKYAERLAYFKSKLPR